MKDRWGRTIDYLRLSLTDRCNLRCRYCMPDDVESVGHDAVLRYEEMMVFVRPPLRSVSTALILPAASPSFGAVLSIL